MNIGRILPTEAAAILNVSPQFVRVAMQQGKLPIGTAVQMSSIWTYHISEKQQTIIEQSKIEETVRAELRQEVEETDREMDVLEYHMRKYCDTDDIEATEFGKENAVDD